MPGGAGKTQLATSHLVKLKGSNIGQPVTDPLQTITGQGLHFGEVRAFLVKYYGESNGSRLSDPLDTITSRDRFGLVTVSIAGETYALADIGLRMLSPRELFRAQGFGEGYVIAPMVGGKRLTKTAQVRMAGNSVCPPVAAALVAANCGAGVVEEVA
jgi:DNA (cytosine-5)-methyltransferase 1